MSETPVNTVSVVTGTSVLRTSPSWATWYVSTSTTDRLHNSMCLKHPATIKNVRDANGSWPRSPWYKSWFRLIVPFTRWETRVKPGYFAWFFPESSTPMLGNLADEQSNQQWIANHSRFQPSAFDVLNAENAARTKVLNAISQKKWDLGVTVLEFAQTADLVTSLATRTVDCVDKLINLRRNSRNQINHLFRQVRKHDDFYRAAHEVGLKDTRLLEDIRDGWMEFQFGIKPLVYDIQDASVVLDEEIFGRQNGLLLVAKEGHTEKGRISVDCSFTGAPFKTRLVCDTKASCHISASYRVPTEGVSRINTLGLDNPYSIGWEVVRLSWMVDYGVGIGAWLSSFSAAKGLEFIDASMSSIQRCTAFEVQHHDLFADNEWVRKPGTTGVVLDSGRFVRDLLPSGVFPAFAPQVKSKLKLVHLANSLSALSTLLGGGTAPR